MLTIIVPGSELWDEKQEAYIYTKETKLNLEHSLLSMSRWEARWKKSFLSSEDKTTEEVIDYIRCMTLNKNLDPNVYASLTAQNINDIIAYINDEQSATTVNLGGNGPSRRIVTTEVVYYWMIAFNIPHEFERWHFSRLLKLIEVCSAYSTPQKKMSKRDVMARNASLNAARRAKFNSKG